MTRTGNVVLVLSVASMGFCGPAAAGDPAAGQTKAAVCAACHGADGNSPNPQWPTLAGQIPEYVSKQLHDFKAGRRSDPLMSPMAQPLSDQDVQDLAAYFSQQKAQPGSGKAEVAAQGEKLYLKGRQRPTVIACTGCHGPTGAGNQAWGKTLAAPPTVLAPALSGQHVGYIVKQLKDYRGGQRKNDVGRVMRDIASRLTDQDIVALAEYITTLKR